MNDTGPARPPKKSELLEVRLDLETKQGFLAACRKAGRTASDVVREQIARWVAEQEAGKAGVLSVVPRRLRKKRFVAIGAALLGLTTFVALPSAAGPDFRATFEKLDADGDGAITVQEQNADLLRLPGFEADLSQPAPTPGDTPPWLVPGADVSIAKMRGWQLKMMLAMDDHNRDGRLDFDEYQAAVIANYGAAFAMWDLDDNGWLSLNEYLGASRPDLVFEIADKHAGPSGDQAVSGDVMRAELDARMRREFSSLDADKDGRIAFEEFLSLKL